MEEITKKKKIIRAKITKKKFFFFLGGWGPEGRQAGRQAGGRGRVIYQVDLWLNYVWPILRDIFMRHPPKVYTTTIRKKKIPHAKLLCGAKISVYVFLSN